ncbi:MAG TPA: hypothetical protein VGM37_14580 [Armatimonadota bacterium]
MKPLEIVTAAGLRICLGDVVLLEAAAGSRLATEESAAECLTGTVVFLDSAAGRLFVLTRVGKVLVSANEVMEVVEPAQDE